MPKPKPELKKSKLTILQVIPNMGAGGAEQTTVDVTAALTKAGHKAIIVSNGGPRVIELQRAGGLHIELPVHSKNPLTIWSNAKKLKKIIREHQVDIIHARSRAPARALLPCTALILVALPRAPRWPCSARRPPSASNSTTREAYAASGTTPATGSNVMLPGR